MPRKKKIKVNTSQKGKFIPQEEESFPQEESVTQEKESVTQEKESLKQLGQKIQQERIAKNLSLESVSGHLHISVKILEAIEEGDIKKGPKPVFLRGLVRTYCHYLGLGKTDIVDKIDQLLKFDSHGEQQLKTLKPVFEIRESHPIRNIVVLLVLIAGGYLLYSIFSHQIPSFLAQDNNTQSKSAIVAIKKTLSESEKINGIDDIILTSPQSAKESKQQFATSGETSPIEDSNQVKILIPRESNITAETVTEKAEKHEVLAETDKTSEKLDIESEISLKNHSQTNLSESSKPEVEEDILEPLTLEVEASEGTWISISVDGNDSKDIRLNTDEIHQWEARKEYLLTLGNTNAVRILLNGREIETNRTHQLLTDWVIDKSFLP